MASAGTAYLGIEGDFTPINKQLGASRNIFFRGLGQMEAKAKQSFTNIGGAAKTIGGAVQSQTGVVNSSLAGIKSGADSAAGALGTVGSQASSTGGALGEVGGQSSGVTEALGEIGSQASGTTDALSSVDDAAQATTGSLGSLDGRAIASAESLGEVGHHATATSADMSKLQGRTDQTAGAAQRSSRIHTNLGKTFNQTGQSVRRLAGGLLVAVSAYRAYAAAKTAVTVTGELARATLNLHRTTGLDIKTSSRWVAVMQARGASAASLSTSMGALARNTRSALDGSEKQRVAFRRLGITQGDLEDGTRDMEGLLEKVADGFGNLKGGIDRADTAQKIFGRGGKDLLPVFAQGNKGLQEQLALADKYHVTFSGKSVKSIRDLIAVEKELKFAQLGLQTQFTQLFAPALTKGLEGVNKFARQVSRIMRDPNLTDEERFSRIGDIISDKLSVAAPQIADAAGRIGPKVAAGFFRGFIHADTWGKIAIAAFLVSKLVGWGNIFRAAGSKGAGAFASRFIPLMRSAGILAGEETALTAGRPGPYRKSGGRAGVIFGAAFRVAVLAGLAFVGFEIGKKIAAAINKATGGGLSGPTSREATAKWAREHGATNIEFVGSRTIHYTDPQGKKKTFTLRKQRGGPISHGMIPGHGSGDKVPVLAEPGEGFINREAVKGLGGPPAIDAINARWKRFQLGGTVSASRRKDDPNLPGQTKALGPERFLSTAYGPPWNRMNGTGKTATGVELRPALHKYIVAVDPSVIPMHSRLTAHPNPFAYSGTFAAEDTGGAINDKHIDFYDWRGRTAQERWGTRYVNVHIKGQGGPVPSEKKGASDESHAGPPPFLAGSRVSRGDVSAIAREWNVNRAIASIGAAVAAKFPAMNIISGFRPGSITSSGNVSNHARHAALDLGTGKNVSLNRRIGTWTRGKFSKSLRHATEDVLDIDHDPNPPDHADHVHVAAFGTQAIAKTLQMGARDDSQLVTNIKGVQVKGKVTFETLLDALGAKLESKLALAKLTPKKSDDLKFQKKLLAYWRGKLKLAQKAKDYSGITEAAGQVSDYRDQIKETREAMRIERSAPELFKLDDLSSLDAGTVDWNIAGLQPQLNRLDLDIAKAGLTETLDAKGDITPGSLADDIVAATGLRDFWQNVYDLTIGKVDLGVQAVAKTKGGPAVHKLNNGKYATTVKGHTYTFAAKPGEVITVGGKKVTVPGGPDFEKRPGTVRGTVAQQIEAATNLKSAKDGLKSLQDDKSDSTTPDTAQRDNALAQLLEEANRNLAVAKAQFPVFERFAKAPNFNEGGIMPGPGTAHQPAWVKPKEGIFTEEQMQALGAGQPVLVVVEDGAVDADRIRVVTREEMTEREREMVRKASSGGPVPGRRSVPVRR